MPKKRRKKKPGPKPEQTSQLKQLKEANPFFPSSLAKIYIYPILAALSWVFGGGLLNSRPKPLMLAWGCMFTGFLFTALGVRTWLINHRLKNPVRKWVPNAWFWAIVVISALGCRFAIQQETSPESDNPDLEPSILIDSVSGGFVLYHYEILNTGKSTAYRIVEEEYGEGVADVENNNANIVLPRELGPGQKMDKTPPPFFWRDGGDYFSKTLVLSYCSYSSGVTNSFRKEFRFFGPKNRIKPGTFHFEFSQDRSSEIK